MNRSTLRLIEQSDAEWLVSLGNGLPLGTTGREASKEWSLRSAGVSADPLRATPSSHEDLYALPAVAENASCKVIFGGVLYNRAALGEQFAGRPLRLLRTTPNLSCGRTCGGARMFCAR